MKKTPVVLKILQNQMVVLVSHFNALYIKFTGLVFIYYNIRHFTDDDDDDDDK